MNEKQQETARFVEQVWGVRILEGPPTEGTPLWQLTQLRDAHQAGLITDEEHADALERLRRRLYPPT